MHLDSKTFREIKEIAKRAFSECNQLTDLVMTEEWTNFVINSEALSLCTKQNNCSFLI